MALYRLPNSSGCVIVPVPLLPRLVPLADQRSLKFRRRPQYVQQEPAGKILLFGVQSLGDRNEADSVILQGLDVVQAVYQ
jgi:hypothetical protein